LFSEEGAEILVDFDFDHGKRVTRVRADGGGMGVWGDDALLGGCNDALLRLTDPP
jgi:hypothetical protein